MSKKDFENITHFQEFMRFSKTYLKTCPERPNEIFQFSVREIPDEFYYLDKKSIENLKMA